MEIPIKNLGQPISSGRAWPVKSRQNALPSVEVSQNESSGCSITADSEKRVATAPDSRWTLLQLPPPQPRPARQRLFGPRVIVYLLVVDLVFGGRVPELNGPLVAVALAAPERELSS